MGYYDVNDYMNLGVHGFLLIGVSNLIKGEWRWKIECIARGIPTTFVKMCGIHYMWW